MGNIKSLAAYTFAVTSENISTIYINWQYTSGKDSIKLTFTGRYYIFPRDNNILDYSKLNYYVNGDLTESLELNLANVVFLLVLSLLVIHTKDKKAAMLAGYSYIYEGYNIFENSSVSACASKFNPLEFNPLDVNNENLKDILINTVKK